MPSLPISWDLEKECEPSRPKFNSLELKHYIIIILSCLYCLRIMMCNSYRNVTTRNVMNNLSGMQ